MLAGLSAGCGQAGPGHDGDMRIARIVRDLLAEPPEWEIVQARADLVPAVEVISPALGGRIDGADMPSLVLAPPCEVRFAIEGELLPAVLRGRVGVDCTALRHLTPEFPSSTVVFEVLGDGRVLCEERVRIERCRWRENVWVELGGPRGIPLEGRVELSLRTTALGPDGAPVEPPLALRAGFGGLRLERSAVRARTRSSPGEPNVVLVVMDTLRADRLSAYGYPRPTSPVLEELARRGVLHEEAHSTASWTWPATASVLTGLMPEEHGVIDETSSFLVEGVTTLAELLQERGVTTAAWSANPIVSPSRNFDQGFERFETSPEDFRKTGEFFAEVRGWLGERGDRRFFLYLHLAEPHGPLVPLEEGVQLFAPGVPRAAWRRVEDRRRRLSERTLLDDSAMAIDGLISDEERAWASDLYDASVWSGDRWLGELLATLAELGLEDETLVAFTSDHGEELFERGSFGHGQSLHRELVRVPLVLAGPGLPQGRRVTRVTSNRLLAPGLAHLAGLELPEGESAARGLLGEWGDEPAFFSTSQGWWRGKKNVDLFGLRSENWSLHLALDEDAAGERTAVDVHLFQVSVDPTERDDVSAEHAELVSELSAMLLERARQLQAARIGHAVRAGAATERLLEQLGYAGGEE